MTKVEECGMKLWRLIILPFSTRLEEQVKPQHRSGKIFGF
jgi:hypothetical protein